jgi:hypothetical protein
MDKQVAVAPEARVEAERRTNASPSSMSCSLGNQARGTASGR